MDAPSDAGQDRRRRLPHLVIQYWVKLVPCVLHTVGHLSLETRGRGRLPSSSGAAVRPSASASALRWVVSPGGKGSGRMSMRGLCRTHRNWEIKNCIPYRIRHRATGRVQPFSRKRSGYARLARTLQAVWNSMTEGILRLTVPERS